MAYLQVRRRKTKRGEKWLVCQAQWDSASQSFKERTLTPTVLHDLGFSSGMSSDQAIAHAKKLNSLNASERKLQKQKVSASENLHRLALVKNSMIPDDLQAGFHQHLKLNWYGNDYNLKKRYQHWTLIQKMLTDLKLQPHEFSKRQREIYKWFEGQKFSKSYVQKLIKVLNIWGEFYSDKTQTFFKKVPLPKGNALEALVKASSANGEGASPLTVESLKQLERVLPQGQFEFMRATLWLGLRPSELELILADKSKMKVEMQGRVPVLSVYQPKLSGVPENKRWKYIPCFHKQMVLALKDIENDVPKKPLVKTLRKALPKFPDVGLYSGRKGFTDLMLSLGQTLENIASWLGHASIERTWKHYKNKKSVEFNEIDESKSA